MLDKSSPSPSSLLAFIMCLFVSSVFVAHIRVFSLLCVMHVLFNLNIDISYSQLFIENVEMAEEIYKRIHHYIKNNKQVSNNKQKHMKQGPDHSKAKYKQRLYEHRHMHTIGKDYNLYIINCIYNIYFLYLR